MFHFFLQRKSLLFLSVIFFLPTAYAADSVVNLTLKEAYVHALKRSETVAIQNEILQEAQGQFLQSLSGVLPEVNYVVADKWQDAGSHQHVQRLPEHKFSFSQPLFSGFKEFAAIRASKAQHKQREQELIRAKQLLFVDVSDAFYFLASYQEELLVVEDIVKALQERVTELQKRQNKGRSRASEVASAQARLYKAQADLEEVKSQWGVARQLMEFLTGNSVASIKDEAMQDQDLKSMEDFVSQVHQRADVQAASLAVEVAERQVTVAQAGFWPTVSLGANSYDKRRGSFADADWDVTLNVNVPLFNGTETLGQVKQAKAQLEEIKLKFSQAQRQAVLEIQNAYTQYIQAQKRMEALKKASEAAEKNYQLQKEDYASSVANNLEVLQALEDWQNNRRDYIFIKQEVQRNYWKLKVVIGDLHDLI